MGCVVEALAVTAGADDWSGGAWSMAADLLQEQLVGRRGSLPHLDVAHQRRTILSRTTSLWNRPD
jgi:hypothetical protein